MSEGLVLSDFERWHSSNLRLIKEQKAIVSVIVCKNYRGPADLWMSRTKIDGQRKGIKYLRYQ